MTEALHELLTEVENTSNAIQGWPEAMYSSILHIESVDTIEINT
jgi:hypothetical protein